MKEYDFENFRFDNAYEAIYDQNGLYFGSYISYRITKIMSRRKAINALKKWHDQSGFTTLGAVGLMAALWAIVLIVYGFANIY